MDDTLQTLGKKERASKTKDCLRLLFVVLSLNYRRFVPHKAVVI
jgi:hypothetical protein